MKPGQNLMVGGGGNSKTQFVICEICDGYIKDLEQLRNHMQWMHKVKVCYFSCYHTDSRSNYRILLLADTPKNDLQPAAIKLPKVSIPFLYRSRSGTTFTGLSWFGHKLDARSR